MFKYIRKNQKQVMAFLGIILMIAFALPSATSFMTKGDSELETTITVGGQSTKITGRDIVRYRNEWIYLKQHISPALLATVLGGFGSQSDTELIRLLSDPQTENLMMQLLQMRERDRFRYMMIAQQIPEAAAEAAGEPLFAAIDSNDEMFALLVSEARSLGVGASSDVVASILAARGIVKETADYDNLSAALQDFLMVNNAAARAASIAKVSSAAREYYKASNEQQVAINLIEYNAKDFVKDVAAPTDAQVQEQFNKYKGTLASESASGFGYKYPNRVKYDAVLIKKDDVRKAIKPVTLQDMHLYYAKNQNTREFVGTTAPSTKPEDKFTLDTGPTTRLMPFEEVKDKIRKKLEDQRTDELNDKVRELVRSILRVDFGAYSDAVEAKKTPPTSSLGVAYDSFDYLKKLRDKVQSETGVAITIEQQDAWQTAEMLKDSPLGKLSLDVEGSEQTLSQYLTSRVKKFLTDEQIKAPPRGEGKPLAVWEPTDRAIDATETSTAYARVTAADASHEPASLDEVKAKLIEDVKLAAAYEKAKNAAQAAVDAANTGKWLQSIANQQNKKLITTGLFSAQASFVTNYELKGQSEKAFVQAAMKLLASAPRSGEAVRPPATTQSTTRPTTAPVPMSFREHPVGLIELPAEGKVLAAEVDQLKPNWYRENESLRDASLASSLRSLDERYLRNGWFNYNNLCARLGYNPAKQRNEKEPKPEDKPQGPINPFVP